MPLLKPCPFCGGKAELKEYSRIPYGFDYAARCSKTGCIGKLTKRFSDKEIAVSMWNKRKAAGT